MALLVLAYEKDVGTSLLFFGVFSAMLYTAINRQKVVFLWPARLPGDDGRALAWHQSAQDAAEHAIKRWVRVPAIGCSRARRLALTLSGYAGGPVGGTFAGTPGTCAITPLDPSNVSAMSSAKHLHG